MHPNPFCTHFPCAVDAKAKQLAAKTLADELGQESKIGDLYAACRLAFQLDITGRRAAHIGDPRFLFRAVKPLHPAVIIPTESFVPVPFAANRTVKKAVELRVRDLGTLNCGLRMAATGEAQIGSFS